MDRRNLEIKGMKKSNGLNVIIGSIGSAKTCICASDIVFEVEAR